MTCGEITPMVTPSTSTFCLSGVPLNALIPIVFMLCFGASRQRSSLAWMLMGDGGQ